MAELIIHDWLAERLRAIAQREHRPVEEVLTDLLERYDAQADDTRTETDQLALDPLAALEGMFDDDITDLSTSIRKTMAAYYGGKHGHSG